MTAFDWSQFTLKIAVGASIEKLYACWATQGGMESWFLRSCEYANKEGLKLTPDELVHSGYTYRWCWHGWGEDMCEENSILEANGKDQFKFSFGKAGNCTVRIYTEGNYTLVELLQDEIPTDEEGRHQFHVGCRNGWTFFLANLKSILEGGIDLRNKDEELKQVLNS